MATPESKVKEKVKKLLKRLNIYYHMPVMNGMGSPTLDFICCGAGYYIAIETKAPGQKPTPRQLQTMEQITKSGGFVFVVATDKDLDYLEAFLVVLIP